MKASSAPRLEHDCAIPYAIDLLDSRPDIKIFFPEAKIIHVKRDSAATCWSNFKQYFAARNLGYSYNLNDTVEYYKLYLDLMKYWNQHFGSLIYDFAL